MVLLVDSEGSTEMVREQVLPCHLALTLMFDRLFGCIGPSDLSFDVFYIFLSLLSKIGFQAEQ
jgi:hypothetical protein